MATIVKVRERILIMEPDDLKWRCDEDPEWAERMTALCELQEFSSSCFVRSKEWAEFVAEEYGGEVIEADALEEGIPGVKP